jgi:hypothetical protein
MADKPPSTANSTPFTKLESGDVGVYRERLMDFVIAQGITLEFRESIAPALGMCYGDRIVLLPGQSPAEEFSTLERFSNGCTLYKL